MASPLRRIPSAVAALAFVALVVLTLVVALVTRSWVGLEAALVTPLVIAVAVLGVWVSLLSLALVRRRNWAPAATIATFILASVVTGGALVDTFRRVVVNQSAPIVHLVLPGGLFGVAASVLYFVARDGDRPVR